MKWIQAGMFFLMCVSLSGSLVGAQEVSYEGKIKRDLSALQRALLNEDATELAKVLLPPNPTRNDTAEKYSKDEMELLSKGNQYWAELKRGEHKSDMSAEEYKGLFELARLHDFKHPYKLLAEASFVYYYRLSDALGKKRFRVFLRDAKGRNYALNFWEVGEKFLWNLRDFFEKGPSYTPSPYDFSSPIAALQSLRNAQDLKDTLTVYQNVASYIVKGIPYDTYHTLVTDRSFAIIRHLPHESYTPQTSEVEDLPSGNDNQKRCKVWQKGKVVESDYEMLVKEGNAWKWIPKEEYAWYPHLLLTTGTDFLKQCLKECNPDLQQKAREVLASKAVEDKDDRLIEEILLSSDKRLLGEIAWRLVEAKDKRGIPVLIGLLEVPECYDMARSWLTGASGKEYGKMIQRPDHQRAINQWKAWWEKNKDTFEFTK